jgi:hypothetical protein
MMSLHWWLDESVYFGATPKHMPKETTFGTHVFIPNYIPFNDEPSEPALTEGAFWQAPLDRPALSH